MKTFCACLILLAVGSIRAQHAPQSIAELRTNFESRAEDTLDATESEWLSAKAFILASQTTSRGSFWSTMSFVAEICDASPNLTARKIRAEALEMLAGRFSDAMRWSSLVTTRFIPNFQKININEWSDELDEYDHLLDRLGNESNSERVRADLLYAKVLARVHIDRRWDWLTPLARQNTIELLDSLINTFGDLLCPGEENTSIRDRAGQHYYELEKLHFGALAPVTSGTDLMDKRFDIKDYLGQIVVVDFWTSFCQPCLAMVPDIKELLDKLQGQPVVYIGVNGDTDRSQALRTAQRFTMSWRNLWDGPAGPAGPVSKAWNVRGWPSVYVVDVRGRIRYKLSGKQIAEKLDSAISTLLAEIGG